MNACNPCDPVDERKAAGIPLMDTCTLDYVRQQKADLCSAIKAALEAFTAETGLTVESVGRLAYTTMDGERRYRVDVEVHL
jgi:hypothetical protein